MRALAKKKFNYGEFSTNDTTKHRPKHYVYMLLWCRFKNGKERYKTSATFNRVVQMLVRNADPYEIIDHLCQMSDDQTKAFEQYIHRDTRPMVMS